MVSREVISDETWAVIGRYSRGRRRPLSHAALCLAAILHWLNTGFNKAC